MMNDDDKAKEDVMRMNLSWEQIHICKLLVCFFTHNEIFAVSAQTVNKTQRLELAAEDYVGLQALSISHCES